MSVSVNRVTYLEAGKKPARPFQLNPQILTIIHFSHKLFVRPTPSAIKLALEELAVLVTRGRYKSRMKERGKSKNEPVEPRGVSKAHNIRP
jgi:hypothetical protein